MGRGCLTLYQGGGKAMSKSDIIFTISLALDVFIVGFVAGAIFGAKSIVRGAKKNLDKLMHEVKH